MHTLEQTESSVVQLSVLSLVVKQKILFFTYYSLISDWKNETDQCQLSVITLIFYPKLLF